jgi:hypothetical protein
VTTPASLRFYGPWLGYFIALAGAALAGLLFAKRGWLLMGSAAFLTIMVIAGSLSRFAPLVTDRETAPVVSELAAPSVPGVMVEEGLTTPIQESTRDSATVEPAQTMTADSWAQSTVEAVAFLESKARSGDVIVANDTQGFVLPALSPIRTYITGAMYQELYGSTASTADIPDRQATSRAFLNDLSTDAFRVLCKANVNWGWVRRELTPLTSWSPYADIVFENQDIIVLKLDRGKCL